MMILLALIGGVCGSVMLGRAVVGRVYAWTADASQDVAPSR